MIKKFISFLVIFSLFSLKVSALDAGKLSAKSAVVISKQTGEIIFEKNAHTKRSMASTTKIMTSLLAIESGQLHNEITVNSEMVNVEGTSMGLLEGDKVSLDELVHGMLLQSGNDAANATAVYLGGNHDSFSDIMNERARKIGMSNTNFITPSGLDSEDHYSTAYDMALLGREAVSNNKFLSVCSKQKETLTYGNPPYRRTLYNHNKLLEYYDYVLGIKTGFTKKSGRCLVSYAERDGIGLVAVTLSAPDDWRDHKLLLDYGFEKINSLTLKPDIPVEIAVVGGTESRVGISAESYVYSYVDNTKLTYEVYLKKFIYAPVNVGDTVGFWRLFSDGVIVCEIPVVTTQCIK